MSALLVIAIIIGMIAAGILFGAMSPLLFDGKVCRTICIFITIIGLIGYVSLVLCVVFRGITKETVDYKEYSLEKLTVNNFYFNDKEVSLSESYVEIEQPNGEYQNVVVVEEYNSIVHWICNLDLNLSGSIYHLYLSDGNYEEFDKIRNEYVIYENKGVIGGK